MQHFYCLVLATLGPLSWNSKMFAAIAIIDVVFNLQVENCINNGILLFNLLFPFTNVILWI